MRNIQRLLGKVILSFIAILFSQNSVAQEITTFSAALGAYSKDYVACRKEALANNQTATETQIDAYCKQKMGAAFCSQQAFFKLLSTNIASIQGNIASASNSYKVQADQQCSAQNAATANAAPTGSGVAMPMADNTGKPIPPQLENYTSGCKPDDVKCLQAARAQFEQQQATYTQNMKAWEEQQKAKQNQASSGGGMSAGAQAGLQAGLGAAQVGLQAAYGNNNSGNNNNNGNSGNSGSSYTSLDQLKLPDAVTAPTQVTPPSPQIVSAATGSPGNRDVAPVVAGATSTDQVNQKLQEIKPETFDAAKKSAEDAMTRSGDALAKEMPELKDKVGDAKKSGDDTAPVQSQITTEATEAGETLASRYKELLASAKPLTVEGESVAFSGTYESFQKFESSEENSIASYNKKRVGEPTSCAAASEEAEKVCVEGTSPGAKAARALMDSAGPLLGVVTSAQKACSGTRLAAEVAGGALTIANVVCMTKKSKCEATCGKALADLNKGSQTLITNVNNQFKSESNYGKQVCQQKEKNYNDRVQDYNSAVQNYNAAAPQAKPGLMPNVTQAKTTMDTAKLKTEACYKDLETKTTFVPKALNQAKVLLQTENKPTPGTFAGLTKKCNDKARNIVGMITTIGSLALSRMSAEKCEKQLASTGGSGGAAPNVSVQSYCQDPSNKATQFCKCQGTAMSSPECGGVAAVGGGLESSDKLGANLKGGPGMSNFAGAGTSGAKPNGNFNINSAGGASTGEQASAALRAGGTFGDVNKANSGSGASGGGAGGSAGSGADGSAPQLGGVEKSKWNFSGFGSLNSGGAGGSGSRGANGGNGDVGVSAQQQALIERRIASERYRAEVSGATGQDNWSKIKSTYMNMSGSLMQAP